MRWQEGRIKKTELLVGLISIHKVPGIGEGSRGGGDWPSSTLTFIQLHPGFEIRGTVRLEAHGQELRPGSFLSKHGATLGVSLWA